MTRKILLAPQDQEAGRTSRASRRFRIAIDAACLMKPKTGIGEYTLNLIHGLSRLEDPDFVLFHNSFRKQTGTDRLVDGLDQAKFRNASLRVPSRLIGPAWQICPWPPADWVTGPVDIFHSTNYRVVPVRRAKLVVTVHDLVVLKYPEYQFFTRVKHIGGWLRRLKRADAVVAISENTRRDIMEYLDIPGEKVHVIYQGYNADQFRRDVPEEDVERVLLQHHLQPPYFLYVGTLEPRKNLVRLVKAFGLVQRKNPGKIQLVLAGGKGWKYEEIFEEIRKLSLHDSVRQLGYVADEDLPGLIKGARAMVYPSLYEGFGLPPLEAMAVGTPVLTSNASSLPEVVGGAGVMVDPEDIEGMAAAMERLWTDETWRESLRVKGYQQAQQFNWDRSARETMDLYHSLLA